MTFSLHRLITILWLTLVFLGLLLGLIIWQLYDEGTQAQVRESQARLAQAAGEIAQRYERYRSTYPAGMNLENATVQAELALIDNLVLQNYDGIEGGLWRTGQGSVAYAFPTHQADSPKRDVPVPEINQIKATVEKAQQLRSVYLTTVTGVKQVLLIQAQWIEGEPAHVVAWTMTRLQLAKSLAFQQLLFGLMLVTLVALISGLWLMRSLRHWSERVTIIEKTVLNASSDDTIPDVSLTGEKELDRFIQTFNRINRQWKESRRKSDLLSRDLARAERLAALGRMTAGLAHELGNPIGAMRLRLDNARQQSPERQRSALEAVDGQVKRLEDLLQRLFFLGKISEIQFHSVALKPWLEQLLESIRPQALKQKISLELIMAEPISARLDPVILGRALENLLLNALQHSSPESRVTLRVTRNETTLTFAVIDFGSGIAPGDREHIFEPFVSRRPEGTGLGLTLVQEAALAHGGNVRLAPINSTEKNTTFLLEIPWQKS